jgi:glyoxylase-like metal-dependent hydrolase (beta-lactamase superfamily II)
MPNKSKNLNAIIGGRPACHTRRALIKHFLFALISFSLLLTTTACKKTAPSLNGVSLTNLGDNVKYGSYIIYKIGEGIYKINDPGVTTGKGGAWGVDMYLVCGDKMALMIDLGNNYIDGYENNLIAPRENAAEELREVVQGLAGKIPLEIAVTHMHPDHDGMTGAFVSRNVTLWAAEDEDISALQAQHKIDPSIYTLFTPGQKSFDLGGGRIVETFQVRGHSNGGTVYILKSDKLIISGDALGSGIGQSIRSAERLEDFAEDTKKLVDHILTNFDPYERYALKVYTGHTWQNAYGGYMHPNKDKVDLGYLDWRFIQDVASCASGIIQGKWLVEGSGLIHAGSMAYTDSWPGAVGQAIMVYGTGTVIIPLEVAHQAAGFEKPE